MARRAKEGVPAAVAVKPTPVAVGNSCVLLALMDGEPEALPVLALEGETDALPLTLPSKDAVPAGALAVFSPLALRRSEADAPSECVTAALSVPPASPLAVCAPLALGQALLLLRPSPKEGVGAAPVGVAAGEGDTLPGDREALPLAVMAAEAVGVRVSAAGLRVGSREGVD